MRNWAFDTPTDETADWNCRLVYTEAMILTEYGPYLQTQHPHISDEQVIDQWITINWASRTDMPPGEYITSTRRT